MRYFIICNGILDVEILILVEIIVVGVTTVVILGSVIVLIAYLHRNYLTFQRDLKTSIVQSIYFHP